MGLVDRPEQFVAAMMGVPIMKQRLEAHHFALNFRENFDDCCNPLESVVDSCHAIRDCENLKTLLFVILQMGNAPQ